MGQTVTAGETRNT